MGPGGSPLLGLLEFPTDAGRGLLVQDLLELGEHIAEHIALFLFDVVPDVLDEPANSRAETAGQPHPSATPSPSRSVRSTNGPPDQWDVLSAVCRERKTFPGLSDADEVGDRPVRPSDGVPPGQA